MKAESKLIINIELTGSEADALLDAIQNTINLIPEEIKKRMHPPRILTDFTDLLNNQINDLK